MAITLTPELEASVRKAADALGCESAEAYVLERLEQVCEQDMFLAEHRHEVSRMIDDGWESAERGDFLTPEEAKAERDAFKRDFLAKRSAA